MGESGWELRGEDLEDGGGIEGLGERTGGGSWENWIGTGGLGVSVWGLGEDTGSWLENWGSRSGNREEVGWELEVWG